MKTYELREHWNETFEMFSRNKQYRDICFENILRFYNEKHRYYHNINHIAACFSELENYNKNGSSCDSAALRVAIWLHDVVYNTAETDNEERSIEFSKLIIIGSNTFYYDIIEEVSKLILLTKHNKINSLDFEEKLLLDIDLSILGQSSEIFDEYEKNIRKEYSWVSDNDFNAGRLKIINSFLDREKIYNLRYFHDKYENTARGNLNRSKDLLIKYV